MKGKILLLSSFLTVAALFIYPGSSLSKELTAVQAMATSKRAALPNDPAAETVPTTAIIEVSGFAKSREGHILYAIGDDSSRLFKLDTVSGQYKAEIKVLHNGSEIKETDWEGIDVCLDEQGLESQHVFFLIDERKHAIYRGQLNAESTKLILDLEYKMHNSSHGVGADHAKKSNTGFESIAVDCTGDKNIVYAATESAFKVEKKDKKVTKYQEGKLFKVDLNNLAVQNNVTHIEIVNWTENNVSPKIDHSTGKPGTGPSTDVDPVVTEIEIGGKTKYVDQDIADMDVYKGELYLLRRNSREVVKLTTSGNGLIGDAPEVVETWSYLSYAPIFKKSDGNAEALAVTNEGFWIGFDRSVKKYPKVNPQSTLDITGDPVTEDTDLFVLFSE